MFSSLKNSDDDDDDAFVPFQKSEKNDTKKVCIDCIGVILSFTSSCVVLERMTQACTSFRKIIMEDEHLCIRVPFIMRKKFPKFEKLYVRVLVIEKMKLTPKVLKQFPNVTVLTLRNVKGKNNIFAKGLPKLQTLTMIKCETLKKPDLRTQSNSLRSLTIESGFPRDRYKISKHVCIESSFLVDLPNLEYLNIDQMFFENLKVEHFQSLKKIKSFILFDTGDIPTEIFLPMKDSLEHLEVHKLCQFNLDHLKELRKLRYLKVNECRPVSINYRSVVDAMDLYGRDIVCNVEVEEYYYNTRLNAEESQVYGFY